MGLSALSRRLVADELRRGGLKMVRIKGWPLSRTIRLIMLKDSFLSKAIQHFLELVRKKVPEAQYFQS